MLHPIDHARQIVYGSREVLNFTYEQSKRYCDDDSVFLEAGVAAGAHIIAMREGCSHKKIYALDSFCGLPRPSNRDNQMPGLRFLSESEQRALPNPGEQVLESTGAVAVSLYDFWQNIDFCYGPKKHNIVAVEGWFENTVPKLSETIEPISILRLDGDLYNSTYVCLKYLYPKVIEGGLVIIDDWALPGCKQAVLDYFNSIDKPLFIHHQVDFIEDKNSKVAYWTK